MMMMMMMMMMVHKACGSPNDHHIRWVRSTRDWEHHPYIPYIHIIYIYIYMHMQERRVVIVLLDQGVFPQKK